MYPIITIVTNIRGEEKVLEFEIILQNFMAFVLKEITQLLFHSTAKDQDPRIPEMLES